ncbi:MAG: response regulator transcription factor [Xenococcaceae cyanobacterium MO_188.B32]|nr:response regulator transcription factor [Xenococcaceae cyanobacterium MO_188.B32]
MIRILLVDDQALLCEVLKTWLEVEEDFEVAGVAHNGEEAIVQVEKLRPDIILMDIDMPKMNGIEATELITERFPQVKVIFLSAHDDDMYLGKSLRAGAKGYLLKNTTAEELAEKIRSVYSDNSQSPSLPVDKETISTIQKQLEDLVQTYQAKFQEQLEAAQASLNKISVVDIDPSYDRRISELETVTKKSWESLRSEVLNVQNQFSEANRNLDSQLTRQLLNLKQEMDSRLNTALADWSRQRAALQEWAVQRDEIRNVSEDFESTYRNELMTMVNPLRASVKDLDRQLRIMRNGLISAIIVATMSLSFAGWLFLFNLKDNGNSARQSMEKLESSQR